MLKKLTLFVTAFVFMGGIAARAQPIEVESFPPKLSRLIPELYGPDGLFVDTFFTQFNHQAHFNSAFQQEFAQFNIALTQQLTAVPLPSSASGFTYEFDPSVGAFTRTTQSFGPILAERAETIGAGKFSFGISFQYFSFDQLEGQDLDAIPSVFIHDQIPNIDFDFENDLVTTVNSIDATLSQTNFFLSYGLANRLDLSVAIPVVKADMTVASNAVIERVSGSAAEVHFFEERNRQLGLERRFVASGEATGIGDIVLRLKGTALERGANGLALGVDVRLPTGDEEDLLGSGATGFKPFFAYSYAGRTIAPHVNLGYQWNGESILAGDVMTGEKQSLPEQVLYAVGVEVAASSRLTLLFDILGQRVIDSPRVVFEDFVAADGTRFPNFSVLEESFNIINGAAGLKANIAGSLLVDFNLLFKLDDAGLRDDVTPLIGIEYTF